MARFSSAEGPPLGGSSRNDGGRARHSPASGHLPSRIVEEYSVKNTLFIDSWSSQSNFEIKVLNPQWRDAGMLNISKYVTYEVHTVVHGTIPLPGPQYRKSNSQVTRRFSDFDWLFSVLQRKYPGVFMPPLPAKTGLGVGLDQQGLLQRSQDLQRFLNRICAHELLMQSTDLQNFLEADTAQDFEKAKIGRSSSESAEPESGVSSAGNAKQSSNGFFQFFREFGQSVTNVFSSETPPDMPSDPTFERLKTRLDKMCEQMELIGKEIGILVKNRKDLLKSLSNFGLALTKFGDLSDDLLGRVLTKCGHGADYDALQMRDYQNRGESEFMARVQDWIQILQNAKVAFRQRAAALLTHQTSWLAEKKLRDTLGLADDNLAEGEEPVDGISEELKQMIAIRAADKMQFDKVVQTSSNEMRKLQEHKLWDFKDMINRFADFYIESGPAVLLRWREVKETAQRLDSSSLPHDDE